MQVAEIVVRILECEGIAVAFGIPGAAINPTYKYLGESTKIRHFIARHEEGAVHAADGYYRACGRMALAICTSGPAATNFVTGLYTASIDSVPLIAITGQSSTALFGTEAFQCVPIADIARPVAKRTYCITDPREVVSTLREAFRIAREGRPGPVLIDLPLDVQLTDVDYDPRTYRPLDIQKPMPDDDDIDRVLDMIMAAQEPVLIMGGGVLAAGAGRDLREFAELLSLPVVTTYMAKGGIPDDHPLHVGHVGIQVGQPVANRFFLNTDMVLGIGCRFSDRHTGNLNVYRGKRKFIHIDIERSQIGRVFKPDLGVVADAKLALRALIERAKARGLSRRPTAAVRQIPVERERLKRRSDYTGCPIKPQAVYAALNRFFADKKALFYTGCGLNQIWSGQLQEIGEPGTYLPSGGAGTLGYDLPAAIGGKLARPDYHSVTVTGDGGFMFTVEELAMASQYHIPVIAVIINNGYLSLIRQNQNLAYKYEYAVDLWGDKPGGVVDIVKLAESMGAKAERVTSVEGILSSLGRAVRSQDPYVIDVICERGTYCSMGTSIDSVVEFE